MTVLESKLTVDEKKTIGEELFFSDCEFCCVCVKFNGMLYFVEVDKNDDEDFEPGNVCDIKVYAYYDDEEYDKLVSSCYKFPINYKVIGNTDNDRIVALTERNPDYYSILAIFMKSHGYDDWKFSFEER